MCCLVVLALGDDEIQFVKVVRYTEPVQGVGVDVAGCLAHPGCRHFRAVVDDAGDAQLAQPAVGRLDGDQIADVDTHPVQGCPFDEYLLLRRRELSLFRRDMVDADVVIVGVGQELKAAPAIRRLFRLCWRLLVLRFAIA